MEGSFKSGLAPILVHLEGADGVVVLGREAPEHGPQSAILLDVVIGTCD